MTPAGRDWRCELHAIVGRSDPRATLDLADLLEALTAELAAGLLQGRPGRSQDWALLEAGRRWLVVLLSRCCSRIGAPSPSSLDAFDAARACYDASRSGRA